MKKLSTKISIVVFTSTLVTVTAMGMCAFTFTRSAMQKPIMDNQLVLAKQTMNKIDRMLYERMLDIQQIAGEDSIKNYVVELAEAENPVSKKVLNKRMGELSIVTGPWDVLFVLDKDGEIVLSASDKLLGNSVQAYPYKFIAYQASMKGEVYYSDLIISKDTGRPSIIFSAPIHDNDSPAKPIVGAVVGNFSWPAALEILNGMSAHAVLLNQKGQMIGNGEAMTHLELIVNALNDKPAFPQLIMGKSRSMILSKKKGVLSEEILASLAVQSGYLSYRGSAWRLVLDTPTKAAFVPATQAAVRLVFLLILILLVSSGILLWMIRKLVVNPIHDLTQTIHGITQGDLTKKAAVRSQDEIGQLALSFNTMTGKLKESHEGLEQKVAERTKELEQSQTRLLQAQKMESLGQLSASIAHDLNNQLTPVRGYLDMILGGVKPDDPNHSLLMEVNQAAIRSVEIVQRLLNFSKPSTLKKTTIKPERLIEEVKKMMPQILPSTIETSVSVENNLWGVLGNETDLQTVIVNLVANARDAMPNGGALTLRAENAQVGGVTVSHGLLPVPHVVISIVDSGTGMTPEVMQKVFEPFFSTKGRAKGAGLGLSMAFQIVKAHEGWIDISTELGKGSAFQIYLPAIVDESVKIAIVDVKKTEGPSKPQAVDQALPRGKGLILFVDDEERLRTMGKYFLEGLGYSVMLAKDGSDAVEKYVENQAKITAVVSDMTMPRMTGKQMLIEILGTNPKAVVILSSGYTDEGTHDDMIALGAADFFQKPYTIKILADSLHQALEKRQH